MSPYNSNQAIVHSNHTKNDIFYDPKGKILIKQVRNSKLTENLLFGDFWAALNPFLCKMGPSNKVTPLATPVEIIFSEMFLVKINIIMGKN